MNNGWIAVDLDGTLARYDGWISSEHIGEPISEMVNRVKKWITEGHDVRIFTARVCNNDEQNCRQHIENWCLDHIGVALPITNSKDYGMIELWDDRCVQVIPNTGKRVDQIL